MKKIYLISGQGSDERIFSELKFNSLRYETVYIPYLLPEEGEDLGSYSRRMAGAIDTSESFILIGMSLGGMIASEMKTFLKPEKTIVISSAKCRRELPWTYRIQRIVPLYAIIPEQLYKAGALLAQPVFEPDRKSHEKIFDAMLRAKDGAFLKRSTAMIVGWNREECDDEIIHLHGTADHTLPFRNVKSNFVIRNGSHMMTLTRSGEIQVLLDRILDKDSEKQ